LPPTHRYMTAYFPCLVESTVNSVSPKEKNGIIYYEETLDHPDIVRNRIEIVMVRCGRSRFRAQGRANKNENFPSYSI
jgi:hypothetical protein